MERIAEDLWEYYKAKYIRPSVALEFQFKEVLAEYPTLWRTFQLLKGLEAELDSYVKEHVIEKP